MPHFDPPWERLAQVRRAGIGQLRAGLLLLLVGAVSIAQPTLAADGPNTVEAASIRLRDDVVFELSAPDGATSAQARAQQASQRLALAVKTGEETVRAERLPRSVRIYVGPTRVLELFDADARAAGDPSLDAHAANTVSRVRQALRAEQRRVQLARTVFSLSLVVFLGIVTLYVVKKIREFGRRLQKLVEEHPGPLPTLEVSSVRLLGPGSVRVAVLLVLSLARWALPAIASYAYLVVATGSFESTRGYAERLTGWVMRPLSDLVSRLATTVPVLVVVLFAGVALAVALRASSQLFATVARGETSLPWVDREIAPTVSALARVGIVVVGLVFAAPLITGSTTGAFAKLGGYLLLALALAMTPILASAGVGAVLVLRRHIERGDLVGVGRHTGRVRQFGLIDMVLEGPSQTVRVPYLSSLLSPLWVRSAGQTLVGLSLDPNARQEDTLKLLGRALEQIHREATATLVALDCQGAHYALSVPEPDSDALRQRVFLEVNRALVEAGIRMGQAPADGKWTP